MRLRDPSFTSWTAAISDEPIGRLEQVPFANSLESAASVPLNSYNFETLSLIRDLMITWDQDITVGRCWDLARQGIDQTGCYDMDHVLIEVSFDQIPDEVRRERFKHLPTGFRLPVESVDELRQAAADILERSADFQKILRDQVKGPERSVPDRRSESRVGPLAAQTTLAARSPLQGSGGACAVPFEAPVSASTACGPDTARSDKGSGAGSNGPQL